MSPVSIVVLDIPGDVHVASRGVGYTRRCACRHDIYFGVGYIIRCACRQYPVVSLPHWRPHISSHILQVVTAAISSPPLPNCASVSLITVSLISNEFKC